MTVRLAHFSGVLKIGTLGLLAVLLFLLGSITNQASIVAYMSLLGIMLLQILEVLYAVPSAEGEWRWWRLAALRAGILLQLGLASVLVAATGGSGSIYELVYLLPIVSAAMKLPGREVAVVVGGAVVAMIGFIVTGEQLTASIARAKDFQDAVAATVYFTIAGILAHLFAQAERDRRVHYQSLAGALADTNAELRRVQTELTDRLVQLAQMEERVHQIGQMAVLGEVAAQVAHEVRNPLGIIKGAAEMLAARFSEPATQRHIAVLLEEVDRLNKAVESVLRLATPLRIQTTRVHLQELLRTVAQAATGWSASSAVQLSVPPGPIWLVGDRDLLHQALLNLVRNALQATPGHGAVMVVAQQEIENGPIRLTIADTGVGLSTEDLKRLGEPFFTKRPGGVGLGFGLARRIVLEHGGTIEVSSEVGQGTCISIQLPSGVKGAVGHPRAASVGSGR
jgi:signal transduction histidine kinase